MGTSREERECRTLLKQHGATFVRDATHGPLYALPDGQRIQLGRSNGGSDHRGWKNNLARIKRVLGLNSQEGVVETEQNEEEEKNPVPLIPDPAEKNGVYVQTAVQILRIETKTYTIPLNALLAFLGVDGSVRECDVRVRDAGDADVLAPLTVEVRTESMETE